MHYSHSLRDQQAIECYESNPKWIPPSTDDFELGILPLQGTNNNIMPRIYGTEDSPNPYKLSLSSLDLQPLNQQHLPRHYHSPIPAPKGWSHETPDSNEQYRDSDHSFYSQGQTLHSLGHPIHGITATHPPAWHSCATTNELDCSSTISPMSPPTPGGHSDVDCNVVPSPSPWASQPSSSVTSFSAQFPEFKTELWSGGGNLQALHKIQPYQDQGFRGPIGGHAPRDSGHEEIAWTEGFPYGDFGPEASYPTTTGQGAVDPNVVFPHGRGPTNADPADEDEAMFEEDADGDEDEDYPQASVVPSKNPARVSTRSSRRSSNCGNIRERYNAAPNTNQMIPLPHSNRINKTHRQVQNPLPSISTLGHGSSPRRPQFSSAPRTGDVGPAKICRYCPQLRFTSDATLNKHMLTNHTRPFICIFARYGCRQNFGSKNEWARHVRVQHLHLEVWKCDLGRCGNPGGSSGGAQSASRHEFDRKDLFTQHVRRMHAEIYPPEGDFSSSATGNMFNPASARGDHDEDVKDPSLTAPNTFHTTNPGTTGRAASNTVPDKLTDKLAITQLEQRIQNDCHQIVRELPAPDLLICPYCHDYDEDGFESWDTRLEHIGKHMEKDSVVFAGGEREDETLKGWLLQHHLLTRNNRTGGEWQIMGCEGKKGSSSNHTGRATRGGGRKSAARGRVSGPAPAVGTRRSERRTRGRIIKEEDEDEDAEGEVEYEGL